MSEDNSSLLEKTYELAKENNKILKSIQRKERFGTIVRVIKWAFIVIFLVWSYSFIQPFLDQLQAVYSGIQDTKDAVGELKVQAEGFGDIFKIFGQ